MCSFWNVVNDGNSPTISLCLNNCFGVYSDYILRAAGSHKGSAAFIPASEFIDLGLQPRGADQATLCILCFEIIPVWNNGLDKTVGQIGVERIPFKSAV